MRLVGAPRRRRVLVSGLILAPIAAILALLAYGFTRDPGYVRSPLLAKPASAFTLPLFDGGTLRLEELRGKVVFLNFWASWCPPCRAEARTLEAAWREYRDRGIVFVGVDIQDKEEDARAFLLEFAITYPNGIDRGNRIAFDYGVWGVPETFIIDRDGRISYKHVGAIDRETMAVKLDEARRGVMSASEGQGDYRPVQR